MKSKSCGRVPKSWLHSWLEVSVSIFRQQKRGEGGKVKRFHTAGRENGLALALQERYLRLGRKCESPARQPPKAAIEEQRLWRALPSKIVSTRSKTASTWYCSPAIARA